MELLFRTILSMTTFFLHIKFDSFHKRKKQKKGWMTIKLDLEKAYDKLHCPIISSILAKFGFYPHWIQTLMKCIQTNTTSVLVNNEPGTTFKLLCSLRQGDLVADFIFIIVMEYLA